MSDRAGLVEALHQDEEVAAGLSADLSALGRKFDDFVERVREWRDEQEERYAELGHDPDLGWTPCPEGADELDQLLEVETFLRGDEFKDLLCEDERQFVEEVRSGILFPHKHLLDIIDRLAPRPGLHTMSELLETLRDALKFAISQPGILRFQVAEYNAALSLLSTPDALAWALLEEMAERDVEVLDSGPCPPDCDSPDDGWQSIRYAIPPIEVDLDVFGNAGSDWCEPLTVCTPELELSKPESVQDLILCLARAIKEQEGRVRDV